MTITLITASFNSVAVIRTALESVLRQTWPEIEYLIIDGGSSDGTLEVIREYAPKFNGRLRWISEPDRGMYDAINKGIRLATGEVIGILNADDVLANDEVIEKVVQVFNPATTQIHSRQLAGAEQRCANGNVAKRPILPIDGVYADVRFVKNRQTLNLDALRREMTVRYYSSRCFKPWMARLGYVPAHPTFYCRRELFERHGCYRIDYRIAADHELLIRMLVKVRIRAQYIAGVLVVMRMGGISTRSVKSTLIINQENIRACRSNGVYTNRLMQLGKYVIKIPGLLSKTCARGQCND